MASRPGLPRSGRTDPTAPGRTTPAPIAPDAPDAIAPDPIAPDATDSGGQGGRPPSFYMALALEQAEHAAAHDDVPIGAVIINAEGLVVSAAGNERELTGDPTAHAEVLAIRRAAEATGDWHLDGHTLVVTLEPCTMCAGAIVQARISRLVFGAYDPKAGAVASLWDVVRDSRLNHRVEVTGGIEAEACGELLRDFFAPHRG